MHRVNREFGVKNNYPGLQLYENCGRGPSKYFTEETPIRRNFSWSNRKLLKLNANISKADFKLVKLFEFSKLQLWMWW